MTGREGMIVNKKPLHALIVLCIEGGSTNMGDSANRLNKIAAGANSN